jgi:hypothetical protein
MATVTTTAQPQHKNVDPCADVFERILYEIVYEIDEIHLGIGTLAAKAFQIRMLHGERRADLIRDTADDISTICGQIKTLSEHLVSVINKSGEVAPTHQLAVRR